MSANITKTIYIPREFFNEFYAAEERASVDGCGLGTVLLKSWRNYTKILKMPEVADVLLRLNIDGKEGNLSLFKEDEVEATPEKAGNSK